MNDWSTLVLGIDPGARHTGLAVRLGNHYVAHSVVEMVPDRQPVTAAAVKLMLEEADRLLDKACRERRDHAAVLVAVEGLVEPNPHLGIINLRGLVGTAVVLGGVLAHSWPRADRVVRVRPAGNGSQLLASYPDELVGAAERRKGVNRRAGQSSLIRHARSAWDVAGQGPWWARAGHAA